ncbi:hypothetical protein [Fimbriimonas ginsengisoli]|uniref:Uncharacterized protein n=1 Tax=Fimbriimonas ginsengisoli Gsoil 348 TaxID=661478 RepID=A0A068NX15_FIMGI|nr:hypothetical protein [Fimbriimonas ginsengisoli]AIE86149.1 hypothetical protein OP10G_2781 [Fimbriimonas ginsengisoli Gsoil 348]
MAAGSRRLWAYLAAAGLCLLTLAVLYPLQDYGPESAIRRFHVAISHDDGVELQRVTAQPIQSENVQWLARQVQGLMKAGARYQLLRMQRWPTQVRAAIVYTSPSDERFPMIWVVEKRGRIWRVDADKTVTIMRDSLGIRLRRP